MKRVIPISFTPGQERVRLINHVVPCILLVINGYDALSETGADPHRILALAGLVVGLIASVLILREMKHAGAANHQRTNSTIRWVEVAVAGVIALEAIHRYNSNKGFQPSHLYFLIALATLGQGVFPNGFPKFRRLVVDEKGFFLRRNFFISLRCAWKEIVSAKFTRSRIDFKLKSGNVAVLRLGRIGNSPEVSEVLFQQLQSMGIETVRA